jgi:hypothetical protein
LGPSAGKERVMRKELVVGGEEPHPHISVEHPIAPSLGVAKFWFKGPAVGAPVDQFGGMVLAGRSHHPEAGAQQDLLLPFHELLQRHRRATLKVYGQAIDRIQKPGTVKMRLRADYCALEVSCCVRQRAEDVGRAAEETERVVIAETRHTVGPRGAANEDRPVVNVAVEIGIGQRDGIGMKRSDDIGPWGDPSKPA